MNMTPGLRKIVLVAHIISSVGSLGAVAGFLALAVAGLSRLVVSSALMDRLQNPVPAAR